MQTLDIQRGTENLDDPLHIVSCHLGDWTERTF